MFEIGSTIFFISLIACVPVGYVYKTIEDVQRKAMLGTGVGMLIAMGLCGPKVIYTVVMVSGNIITIKFCEKRYIHKMSLTFTLMLLLYVYLSAHCTRYSAWLYQTLALRMVGLAFELTIYEKAASKVESKTKTTSSSSKTPLLVLDDSITRLSAADIVTYAYFFLGLHRGPYYTWKVFNDHLNSSISRQGDFWEVTDQKLRKAFILTLGYAFLRSKYPLSIYEDDEFYKNYGTDYRFLFCMPQLIIYYLESQIILMISTAACSAAGFGVYPVKAAAVPGSGPTKPVADTASDKEEYNFAMLKCFDNEKILMGPKMKDTTRGWDMATRYWFSQYIVKNLINNNFEVRSACSFLVWTIWTGSSIQDIIIALTLWVYIHLESDYAQLYAETLTGPWNLGFAIMRIFCLCYLTPCLILTDRDVLMRFYNSIYWIYHIVLAVLFVAAIAVHKSRTQVRFSDADALTQKLESKTESGTTNKPEATKDSGPSTSASGST